MTHGFHKHCFCRVNPNTEAQRCTDHVPAVAKYLRITGSITAHSHDCYPEFTKNSKSSFFFFFKWKRLALMTTRCSPLKSQLGPRFPKVAATDFLGPPLCLAASSPKRDRAAFAWLFFFFFFFPAKVQSWEPPVP